MTTATMRDGQNLNFVLSARHITELVRDKRVISLAELLSETQVTEPLVALVTSDGQQVFNSRGVKSYGHVNQRLPVGQYTLYFDNRFSMFSSKTVSPDFKLIYYR